MDSQSARGIETSGGLKTRFKAFIPILGPLVLGAIGSTEEKDHRYGNACLFFPTSIPLISMSCARRRFGEKAGCILLDIAFVAALVWEDSSMNSIILSNITYRYPLTDFDALHDVSFCFEEGKFYGVIGPNGAGKTTLCSLVKGLIPGFFQGELTGDVQILGKRMESWDESELTSRVGYIFQNPFTQISGVKDTVFEEIAIGLENLRMPKGRDHCACSRHRAPHRH